MKIALVVTNLRGGGAEKAMIKLGALLSARGHELHLVLLEHLVDHAPPTVLTLHSLTSPNQASRKGWLGKRLAARKLRELFTQLAAGKPFDLVVSTLPYADEVVQLARIPGVWHRVANTLSAEVAALARRHPRKAKRRLARYQRLYEGRDIVAVSEGVKTDLQDAIGLQQARIVCIHNPIDFDAIRASAEQMDLDVPQQAYIIHVGRFARQKRHDVLLDAWKQAGLPCKLVLLTQPCAELDQLIRDRGLNDSVVVAGFRQNPYPWMKHARLLVLSSDHEGMPNVLVEALALGTPVVSTDCPSGPREILTGPLLPYLVPPGNVTALADAMVRAFHTPPDVSHADLARFDADAVAARYEALATRSAGRTS